MQRITALAILALSVTWTAGCNNKQGMGEGNPQQTDQKNSSERDNVRQPHTNANRDNRNPGPPPPGQTPNQPAARSSEH